MRKRRAPDWRVPRNSPGLRAGENARAVVAERLGDLRRGPLVPRLLEQLRVADAGNSGGGVFDGDYAPGRLVFTKM
jgi:hypothetical protein